MSTDPSSRIVRATLLERRVAMKRPLRGARGPVTERVVRVLRLEADDGATGIGEASRVDWLSPREDGAAADDDAMLVERILADQPPSAALTAWSLDVLRPSALRSALQTALLDLDARRQGIALAGLLGASDTPPEIPLSALVGDDAPDAMAREAAACAARGLSSFKVKVGRPEASDDVARVAAVRSAIGPGASLRLDANGAWKLDEARRALEALARFGPDFVEEPLFDRSALASLASPIPVALDESVSTPASLESALRRGGFAVLVLKLERVGGPLPALSLATRATRAGVRVVFTDSIDGEVGRAATLHVAAAAAARSGSPAEAVGLGGLFVLAGSGQPRVTAAVTGPGLGIDVEVYR
jgi:L-Ala-D/L-Glu epimerase